MLFPALHTMFFKWLLCRVFTFNASFSIWFDVYLADFLSMSWFSSWDYNSFLWVSFENGENIWISLLLISMENNHFMSLGLGLRTRAWFFGHNEKSKKKPPKSPKMSISTMNTRTLSDWCWTQICSKECTNIVRILHILSKLLHAFILSRDKAIERETLNTKIATTVTYFN